MPPTYQDCNNASQQLVVGPVETTSVANTVSAKAKTGLPDGIQPSGEVLKTGTILYAVLDAAVDSDLQAPVIATVVSGPLTETKLIGTFQQSGEWEDSLLLQFNTANIPGVDKSVPISLFAIDMDTARNTTIDNHYLVKYGALFGASFLQGLSSAIQKTGKTTITSNGSLMTTTTEALSDPKLVAAGLGAVGSSVVETLQKTGTVKPTIRMKKGATFAVLFMSDFNIPETNS